jgi:hypothetical protein
MKKNPIHPTRKRAETYQEIQPLLDLCKAGKLFDVQKWIAEGNPIDPPLGVKSSKNTPLWTAIELGFHSLVEVLLEGGAQIEEPQNSLLCHALEKRRLDLIELLVKYGSDAKSVPMELVMGKGDRRIIDFFIEQGGDLETGNPLAQALCDHIYPVLGVFKQYEERFPSLKEQVNIALRHSCQEGNLKWVSLMLWAGADPYAKGPSSPGEEPDPEEDCCALELGAIFGHLEIFKLKPIRLTLTPSRRYDLFRWACQADKADLLIDFLTKSFDPKTLPDSGSSLIQVLLTRLCLAYDISLYDPNWRRDKNIDCNSSRERIKMIHLLARNGAKWQPKDNEDFNRVRYSLRKMDPDYILEFIWIMGGYQACSREAIEQLIGTSSIKKLISEKRDVVEKLLRSFEVSK